MDRIYKGWQASYTKKSQELAEKRKAHDAENAKLEERKKLLDEGWSEYNMAMWGTADPHTKLSTDLAAKDQELAAVRQELETLKSAQASGQVSTGEAIEERTKLQAELATLREEKAQLETLRKEKSELEEKYKGYDEKYATAEKRATDAEKAHQDTLVNLVHGWYEKTAPDVLADFDAFELSQEIAYKDESKPPDYEKGVAAARAYLATKSGKPTPERATPAEEAMSIGGRGPSGSRPVEEDDYISMRRRQKPSNAWNPG
jgi:hypothetical protein